MESFLSSPFSKYAIFAVVLVLQSGLLGLLFAVVYGKPLRGLPLLQRRAPLFLGVSLLLAPLVVWMAVQLVARDQPAAALVASAASSSVTTSSWAPQAAYNAINPSESTSWEATATFTAQQIELGKRVAQEQNCTACHSIRGKGGVIAPDLSAVKTRRSPLWIYRHFQDPQSLSPGTLMPKFQLTERELVALTAYIWTLQE